MLVRRINVSQVRRAAWRRKTYCGGGEVLRWPREGHACRGTAPRPHGEARHATQGGRRGFLKKLMMIAFLLGFCGIDLFEDGPWAVGAHWGMRRRGGARRGDGLLAAALGRVRGACEHRGVSMHVWALGPFLHAWQEGSMTLCRPRKKISDGKSGLPENLPLPVVSEKRIPAKFRIFRFQKSKIQKHS